MKLKDKIIAAAYDLFTEKGFERTTVTDIIEQAGTSKGGFYHHFKKKEDILSYIVESYIDSVAKLYNDILVDRSLNVIDQFTISFEQINDIKKNSVKDWKKLKNLYQFEGNHLLLINMSTAFEKETTDFYHKLILKGNEENIFHVQFPYELASLWSREIIHFHRLSRKFLLDPSLGNKYLDDLLSFDEQIINQQLGLKEGEINFLTVSKTYLNAMRSEILKRRTI